MCSLSADWFTRLKFWKWSNPISQTIPVPYQTAAKTPTCFAFFSPTTRAAVADHHHQNKNKSTDGFFFVWLGINKSSGFLLKKRRKEWSRSRKCLFRVMLRSLQRTVHQVGGRGSSSGGAIATRAFASSNEPFLPRITERRVNEAGAGGRSTNAGVKVAIFGATGFLGKHVCFQLGKENN